MCEEKSQGNDVASGRTSCCGPDMEQKMWAFFASMRGEREDETGSCADRMAEMMKACCGSFVNEGSTKR